MAYIYANTNPMKRNTRDCVIRAISMAMSRPWEDVYMDLAYQGLAMCDIMESNAVWGSYLKEHGFVQEVLPSNCPICYTVDDFCREFPNGIYIVATGTHAVACINGDVYDTTDCRNEIVSYYFYDKEEF